MLDPKERESSIELSGTLIGRVTTTVGDPIAGARAWLEHQDPRRRPIAETTTDSSGRFRLGSVAATPYATLWTEAPNHARAHLDGIRIFPGIENDVGTIVLGSGIRLRGRVVDAREHPIAEAKITIHSDHFMRSGGWWYRHNGPAWTHETDREGQFTSDPLPPGLTTITVQSPGKGAAWQRINILPSVPIEDVVIHLADEQDLSGFVVDEKGSPVSGATLIARHPYLHHSAYEKVVTDVSGAFRIGGVNLKGLFIIEIKARGYDLGRFGFQQPFAGVRLPLKSASEICGQVVDAAGRDVRFDDLKMCRIKRNPDGSFDRYG